MGPVTTSVGTLYVVATPIGNLDDLSRRAERVLAEADWVVAEDTRRTQKLLSHLGLTDKTLRRLDANAGPRDVEAVVSALAGGRIVALCTDAGTPGVSDPGAALVTAARAREIPVVPIPGPSAVTTALCASGYAFGAFRFVGFLPRGGLDRARAVAEIAASRDAVVLFESPQRLAATLTELATLMASRRVTVARELTKLHEQIVEGELSNVAASFAQTEILGELTVVLAPWDAPRPNLDDSEVERRIEAGLGAGLRPRDLAERVALETGRSKREVYDLIVRRTSALKGR
ncbi:MAG: 16S rRNA (cytidine(1402)-2'-O)-methyltransferase [Polyangiaceae bacterium]|nr:16S rRNA (cytidine(1402)-2'-O)-methyltransferase [Polyangiaceae bacterium]MBK8941873.1 16S rRNA (cytidine(1402)-2'-O)-methyltransferase [Polyangiaceae bacterium]